MQMTSERKLPLILTFVFLMLAVIGLLFYQSTVSLQEAIAWEKHAQDVTLKLENTMTLTLDAEAEMRGFIITGNTTYLEQFERSKTAVFANLSEIRALVSASRAQLEELANLESSLGRFWDVAFQKIERRKQGGFDAGLNELSMQETKAAADQARASIERMKSAEAFVLQARNNRFSQNLNWAIRILIIATVAGVLALVAANFLVWREGKRRSAAERALIESNKELESRIAERTVELSTANASLQAVAAERESLLMNEQAARREAEIANRLRDEFMATVSHELRTPLNSILGWARLMKNGTLSEEQSVKAVRTIIKNSETQNRLIEDLLDVARIISGKLELDLKPIKIADAVRDAIEIVRPDSTEKNISINCTVEPDCLDVEVLGDANRLGQVFSNLLTNAIKFSSENGMVDVTVSRGGDKVDVTVKDTGVGISQAFLPMVFERFRQDVGTDSNKSGLGLGLAIVRNLVELHGGTARASSDGENEGATFMVSLPVIIK